MAIEGKCEKCGGDTVDYMCVNCVDRARRGFKAMTKQLFAIIEQDQCMPKIKDGQYERAGGDVECELCGMPYVEHPEVTGFPTFHMVCTAQIFKL